MSETRREIGHYLASQPLGDEQVSDDDLALLLYVATHHSQFGRLIVDHAAGTERVA